MVARYKIIIQRSIDYFVLFVCFFSFSPVPVRILECIQPTWVSLNRKEMY